MGWKPQGYGSDYTEQKSSSHCECWVPETKALSSNSISGEEGAKFFTTSIKEQLRILVVPFSQEVQYRVRGGGSEGGNLLLIFISSVKLCESSMACSSISVNKAPFETTLKFTNSLLVLLNFLWYHILLVLRYQEAFYS